MAFSNGESNNSTFVVVDHDETSAKTVCDLFEGEIAEITDLRLQGTQAAEQGASSRAVKRLIALGLSIGKQIRVVHKSPFGGSPMAVNVQGSLVGLNHFEAEHIVVQRNIS